MAQYLLTANITYSSAAARTTAATNVTAVLAQHPSCTPVEGRYPAGTNTPGTTGLTLSYTCPDEAAAKAISGPLTTAWASGTRTAGHTTIVRT